MNPRIFIIALVLAMVAMFLAWSVMSGRKDDNIVQSPQVEEKKVAESLVYVAKTEIPVGTIIDQSMIDRQTWPEHLVSPNMFTAGSNAPTIIGTVARSHFNEREVIMRSMVANPDDPSFLAASMPEGMRAVSVAVDGVTSVAGFIYPGDRVDVLLTHTLKSQKEREALELENARLKAEGENPQEPIKIEDRITEILVPDVRVLAVDQRAMAGQEEDGKQRRLPTSITLELDQEDAQRVRLAEREGEITLVLRSLKDKGISLVRPSAEEDLTRTLPPGHFEKLYGFDEEFTEDMVVKKERKMKTKTVINVVRGVKVEEQKLEMSDENN